MGRNDGKYQVDTMMKRKVISLALLFILVAALLVAPVAAGLTITDGEKIISRTGNTSPVITITDSDIADKWHYHHRYFTLARRCCQGYIYQR